MKTKDNSKGWVSKSFAIDSRSSNYKKSKEDQKRINIRKRTEFLHDARSLGQELLEVWED